MVTVIAPEIAAKLPIAMEATRGAAIRSVATIAVTASVAEMSPASGRRNCPGSGRADAMGCAGRGRVASHASSHRRLPARDHGADMLRLMRQGMSYGALRARAGDDAAQIERLRLR